MTTPKEALERALEYLDGDSPMHSRGGHRNETLRAEIKLALASLEGDAVERVARIWAKARNEWMRASRHGTQEEADKAAVAAILATGLVADEAAIRADWHTTGWDRARNSGRILLVWREFAGVREHVELGRYSDSKTAWVNTYGHPFHANPDGWAPLLPFKTAEAIRADEREKCAKVADGWLAQFAHHEIKYVSARMYASDAIQDIATAIRKMSQEVKHEAE